MMEIDLRSDTVTKPTPAMWEAMARAEVGDDVFGEDPTVNRLEARAAEILGKDAALFVASGTMANLAAVLTHCQRGDEVILGDLSHTYLYEAGGVAALGGVHPRAVRTAADGRLALEEIEASIREDNIHFPTSRLICLENTHNRCGGSVLPAAYIASVGEIARRHDLRLHIDGARIFHAAVAQGITARELVAPADSVAMCLSKGLCAPVGSLICGTSEFIGRARRIRKQLGGGMRQAGVIAAAGIVALETMIERLADDHRRARALAAGLSAIPGIEVETPVPASNMVYFALAAAIPFDAEELTRRLAARGVRIHSVQERRIRLVTHYWIDDEAIDTTIAAMRSVL
jgi:threonine aldolase